MRTFRSKVLSACTWALPALAAVLPATHDVNHPTIGYDSVKSTPLELVQQEDYAQATFTVPCPGCLGPDGTSQDDDSLVIDFRAFSEEEPCGVGNVTVNGYYLPQEWHGDTASGSGYFERPPQPQENAWYRFQNNLDLEWESTCIHSGTSIEDTSVIPADAAQVFTLTIKGANGRPLDKPSGFTISYKQLSPPEILRLERAPNYSAKHSDNSQSWREPPAHLRLSFPTLQDDQLSNINGTPESSLEDDIQELKALEAEVAQLHKAIEEKKKAIQSQFRNETKTFTEELRQCQNLTCVVKTIGNKAHGAWNVAYITFRPGHHHHTDPPVEISSTSEMGRPDDRYHRLGNHKQAPEYSPHDQISSSDDVRPEKPEHGATGSPLGKASRPNSKNVYVIALEILVGVLCCGCIVTVIRHRCSSLRTRTERAATREERANARAYRRAARKLRWQNWWRRTTWRDQERIADYEEKRALINEQESILEDAMQSEIRQLREAHGLVNSLVQAEEGRLPHPPTHPTNGTSHCHHCRANPPPRLSLQSRPPHQNQSASDTEDQPLYSPSLSSTGASSIYPYPSPPLSRTSSLPGYPSSNASTAPPAYESDEDTSEHVANGFRRYTPSTMSEGAASSRWITPGSSVVDVSPRPSAETLRFGAEAGFAETTLTGVGDEKN